MPGTKTQWGAVLALVGAVLLAGCTPTTLLSTLRLTGGPTRMMIDEATVVALFAEAPADTLHIERGRVYLSLYCQLLEGAMCDRVPFAAVEGYMPSGSVSDGAVFQIGRERTRSLFLRPVWPWGDPWKYVEHAQYNAVWVRCHRPEKAAGPIQCWVGFGRGWEPALVF